MRIKRLVQKHPEEKTFWKNDQWFNVYVQVNEEKRPDYKSRLYGEFDRFGFEAEDKYASLAEDDEHNGWRLFRRFKMVLHNNKRLTKDVTVKDFCGKQMTAFPLFVMSIKYLREHLLQAVTTQKIGIEETDILYVLTVPAIWDDNAKRFMRDAAVDADIDPARLKLALEPECASIWCETLGTDVKGAVAIAGSQYMVVDLGGGTADVSVHERKPDGSLKEIMKASGGPWGGIFVDENYMKLLDRLYGEEALTDLRKTEMSDYFDIIREFEHKKRTVDIKNTKHVIVRLSVSLRDLANKYSKQSLEERIAALDSHKNAITPKGKDKLKVDWTVIQSWFKIPIDLLIQHIKTLLAEPKMKRVQTVILVGGFGESQYVQDRIRKEIPDDLKYTYGTNVFQYFDENKYPDDKKVWENGKWQVPFCFKVYVRVNEQVKVDQQMTKRSTPNSKISLTAVYRTTQEHPKYITDPGCELLGTIELENSTDIPFEQQRLETTFMFGDTELFVKTKNKTTGKEAYMTFECFT
ncbi:heat shock 70 kDa protein 12A-like [Mya arenaria]|uniref:heat shock 70 kDa protein 12A-like n=1 Tax=Mya arenaria TaxID=6604 RepID=UPI0022E1D0E5|nr:heat shock 70 kDa protein 12A-like [Mya arenaria]